jgi:hypothetical protein
MPACLQVALQLMLRCTDDLERAAASHLMHSFCHANALGQTAVLSTLAASRELASAQRNAACAWCIRLLALRSSSLACLVCV